MKIWKYTGTALALAVACSAGDRGAEEATGSLLLPLTATDNQGEVYRLRNASFFIEGYPQYAYSTSSAGAGGNGDGGYYYETVTTEHDPNAAVITRRVVPGTYYVSFNAYEPWYIEHLTASGPVRVAESVLLSTPRQSAYVYDQGSSSVFYRFGVNGRTIDFRHGDLSIRIGIEHPNQGEGGMAGMGGAAF
jgi:hypothetical protein